MKPEEKLIIAIDSADIAEIMGTVERLGEYAETFKIGSTAFNTLGPTIVKAIGKLGKNVFIDLKLFDIPEQVAGAARALTDMGASMITVHALGGPKMMAAAKKASLDAAGKIGTKPPLIFGVTILTSLDDSWLARLKIPGMDETVPALALAAEEAGLDGVVAAAREVAEIKNACGGGFIAVTPGIRLPDNAANDQVRIASPDAAIRNGADYLVVGRSVTGAPDPGKAAREILEKMR
ncbi:MAG: orotidine-5'-phosphate decarboxylase [Actinomycetota bacterium]